jgi:adenylate cyclase
MLSFPQRAGRRLFAVMPSPWRCKFCNAPFRGPYAGTMKRVGYTPSRKNPQICARCIERAPEGGAIVPVTILFADVRGYTSLCEQMTPAEVGEFVQCFYQTASSALLAHEGLLGQIAGDEVEGLFVPGLAGPKYRQKAVEAARSLVRVVRYTDPPAGTLEVGIGIASGEEFVGNVAGGGYKDFAAVGDVTNTAARLTSAANSSEIVVDEETYGGVARAYPDAERQRLVLKGKHEPLDAYWIPP